MATVDGITVARAQEIEDASVVSGAIDLGNGHLYLTTSGGTVLDAGIVIDDTHLNAHAAATATHGVLEIVGTTKSQTLTNKTYQDPIMNGAVVINSGGTFRASSMTPVQAKNSTGITKSNSTFSEGTCALQVVAPPSGVIEIKGWARCSSDTAQRSGWFGYAVYEGVGLDGTQTLGPANSRAANMSSGSVNAVQTGSFCDLVTGLTPGSTYTVTTMVKTDTASPGIVCSYGLQSLVVTPQP